jgi:hypothetical protein
LDLKVDFTFSCSFLLSASHAVEHNHQVNWEEVTILAKEINTRKRKIHEAAAMHIEDNVISQSSIDIPPLWHSILRKEKRVIIRERKPREEIITTRSTNRARGESKRGREEEHTEQSTKRPALSAAESSAVDRRHLYRLKLRRHTRRPARLIECN